MYLSLQEITETKVFDLTRQNLCSYIAADFAAAKEITVGKC